MSKQPPGFWDRVSEWNGKLITLRFVVVVFAVVLLIIAKYPLALLALLVAIIAYGIYRIVTDRPR